MVGFSLLLAIMEVVRAQVDEMPLPLGRAVPITPELKCVSGFCLPRGYKKLETPITEGKYRKSSTSFTERLMFSVVCYSVMLNEVQYQFSQ